MKKLSSVTVSATALLLGVFAASSVCSRSQFAFAQDAAASNQLPANTLPSPTATPAREAPSIQSNAQAELDRDDLLIRFTREGACIEDIQLKGFKETHGGSENAHVTGGHFNCRALALKVGSQDLRTVPADVKTEGSGSVTLTQKTGQLEVSKILRLAGQYSGELVIQIKNTGSSAWTGPIAIDLGGVSELKGAGSLFGSHPVAFHEASYFFQDKVKRQALQFEDAPKAESLLEQKNFSPDWVASNSLYFALALMPKGNDVFDFTVFRTGFNSAKNSRTPPDRTLYEVWLTTQITDVPPGGTRSITFDVFAGPKSKSALSAFSGRNLQKNIDYGFFSIIAWPLFYFLAWCEGVLKNWGLAIIVLTIALKILLYPLTEKAFVAGKKMQKIQPELNALKEKFKDDKQAQQREMMALMAQRGVNPMSGCLPILPQLPIFFGLNAVLTHTFELRHAHFAGWLNDLTARDPLYITPALMAVLMYAQQKLTPAPTSMDPAQQKMMQFMPLIFAVFMLTYPSGLVLYIITNTVLSLLQQQYMTRKHKVAE
ncbi:membrane protein insertase YidC [bacterium]|nr:membrane protein insertase YidC [bacterium]